MTREQSLAPSASVRTAHLTRVETRALLLQLHRSRDKSKLLEGKVLNKAETARHILMVARDLWAAAVAARQPEVSALLEGVFYEAYLASGGILAEAQEVARAISSDGPGRPR
jgi:hypothetical protein